jgi:predicted SnoaL-like aldol condensation-catalyzing enzyme
MAKSKIEKALTLLQGIGSGNADLATRHVHPKRYVEHGPRSADGVDGLREYIRELFKENHDLKVAWAFQEGISSKRRNRKCITT